MRNTDVSVTFRRYIIKVLFSVNIYVVWISVSTSEALNTRISVIILAEISLFFQSYLAHTVLSLESELTQGMY